MLKNHKIQIVRLIVQVIFLVLFPALFALTFAQLKQIYVMLISNDIDWLTLLPNLVELLVIIPATFLIGRFFCGWICAFGTFNDILYLISSKLFKTKYKINKKVDNILKYAKYFVLVTIVYTSWTAGIKIFSKSDPWDAFAQLPYIVNSFTGNILAFVLLFLIAIGAIFIERFFCRYLCPLGAIFNAVSLTKIHKVNKPTSQCGPCRACSNGCSMGIDLNKSDKVDSGECIECLKCVDVCPKDNANPSILSKKITPLQAGILVVFVFSLFYSLSFLEVFNSESISNSSLEYEIDMASEHKHDNMQSHKQNNEKYSNHKNGNNSISPKSDIVNDPLNSSKQINDSEENSKIETSTNMKTNENSAEKVNENVTTNPTLNPIQIPTTKPTSKPISNPTIKPTLKPTIPPTQIPTSNPTSNPSKNNSAVNTELNSGDIKAPATKQKFKDGTYTGVAWGYRPGLQVSVTLKNDKITNIKILSHRETPHYARIPFAKIPQQIIDSQSTEVDTVSGATLTCIGISDAVEDAMNKALY